MAQKRTKSKSSAKRPRSKKPASKSRVLAKEPKGLVGKLKKTTSKIVDRNRRFMSRRPHRSFSLTRRRDYKRSFKIGGYFAFTNEVLRHLIKHKAVFLRLIVFYAVLSALLVGLASQASYQDVVSALNEMGSNIFSGGWGELGKAGLLVVAGATGSLTQAPNDVQQIYGVLLFIMLWLTVVWLLRMQIAGNKPRMRDGLYSSGAPLFASTVVAMILLLQLIPAALATVIYGAALSSGLLEQGVVIMAFSIAALLLVVLSVYLITSSFLALVVVTLPGMYPWRALQISGDLVVGRRLRILLRMLWSLLVAVVFWAVVMVPALLLVNWFQSTFSFSEGWPVIPVLLILVSSTTTVFVASYTYMLYRKVVDDEASPA